MKGDKTEERGRKITEGGERAEGDEDRKDARRGRLSSYGGGKLGEGI